MTCLNTTRLKRNDNATPAIVTQCAPARPILRPDKPAIKAPAKGANTMIEQSIFTALS